MAAGGLTGPGRGRGRVGGILVIGGVVCVVLVMAAVMFFGSAPDASPASPVAGCGNGSGSAPRGRAARARRRAADRDSLDADQTGNARTIVQVASLAVAAHGLDAAAPGARRPSGS